MTQFRRAAIAVVLAFVLLPMLVVGAGAQSTPSPSAGTFRLVRQSDWVASDGTFTLDLTHTGFAANTKWNVDVWGALANRSQLDRALSGSIPTYVMWSSPAQALTGTTASISIPVRPRWPAPTDGVVLTEAGVYPVVVNATDANGRTIGTLTTFLLRLGAAGDTVTPLSVAPVMTIGATPTVSLDGTTSFTDDDVRRATEQLLVAGSTTASMSIAADAALAAAVAESTPAAARNAASVTRELIGRPWVDLDTGALVGAGLATMWNRELIRGDASLTDSFETKPDRAIQPIDRHTSPAALAHLVTMGTRSVIVPSGMLDRNSNGSGTLTRGFTLQTGGGASLAAVASDDATARRLLAPVDAVLAAHEALAQLVMLHIEQPGADRGIAVLLPRESDPATLRGLLRALGDPTGGTTGAPLLTSVTATRLLASAGATRPVVKWSADEPGTLGDYPNRLAATDRSLDGLHSLVPDDSAITGPIDDQVLASAAAGITGADRTNVLFGADRAIDTAAKRVGLPPSQSMTLTSRTGRIPLNLRNDFPVDARVRVRLVSPKLDFPEGSIVDTTLSPSGITRIDVQVSTRATGSFQVDVIMESIDGTLPVDTGRVTVRSTAISGLGLVLSVGAGLFLLAWWGSHFRKVRRARRLVDEPLHPKEG